jgi:hypothetical protein
MTPVEVSEILAYASSGYPHINLSKETVSVYVDLLGDLDYGTAKRAVRRLVATSDYFPSPASIRREVASLSGMLAPTANEALEQIRRQIELRGSGENMERWLHPAVEETVRALGGVREFAMTTNFDTMRAHFLKMYERAVEKHDKTTLLTKGAQIGELNEAVRTPEKKDAVKAINQTNQTDTVEVVTLQTSDPERQEVNRRKVTELLRSQSQRMHENS